MSELQLGPPDHDLERGRRNAIRQPVNVGDVIVEGAQVRSFD